MMHKIFAIVAGVLSLFVIGGFTAVGESQAADTIRIGFVADISGIGAGVYKGQQAGINLFVEETNAAGGGTGQEVGSGSP